MAVAAEVEAAVAVVVAAAPAVVAQRRSAPVVAALEVAAREVADEARPAAGTIVRPVPAKQERRVAAAAKYRVRVTATSAARSEPEWSRRPKPVGRRGASTDQVDCPCRYSLAVTS